jgi:McbB family protein
VKRVTYQKIIDQLYEYEADFEVQTPLSPRWRLNVATQLVNRIDRLITASNGDRITLDEIGTAHVFNLNTMQEYQDVTTHWELCDCYE